MRQSTEPQLRFPEFKDCFQKVRLGKVTLKVGSGSTPKGGASSYVSEGIPLIRSQNVKDGYLDLTDTAKIDFATHSKMKGSHVYSHDVLLNITGASIGRSCIVPSSFVEGNVNQHVCIIRSKEELLHYRYLNQFLNSKYGQRQIDISQAGGGREGLNFEAIKGFVLPVISHKEQQKIADFLTAVDSKISQLTEKHRLLKAYKKGVMQQLFSQKIRFKDDEGKAFPEWCVERIGKYLEPYKELVSVDTKIPVLTSSRTGLYPQERAVINEGDYGVVPLGYFTYRHMSDDLVFKFNVNRLWDKGAVSKEYPVFKTVGMDSYFLELQLNEGNDFKRFAIQQKQGGTRTRLYFKNLKELKLNLPSLKEQQKIAQCLQALDKKIDAVAEQIEQTKLFKKGLLQQMFV
ncbi:restriction endonuclease subunit S [Shewanella sp. JBTF-M18]|uniref:Restriction endonuclease subunit S n=1 Tax=Shewanella insulae TaxID=2681496 RepID=A0A6L7I323_9GAMM|nr:restriction endonuclease subunit S [Shewanella insulae]MXR70986.1 restriction endonuclease subunit S [Shewanella insulae]